MGLFHSPKIVTDGLWACWDFANKKSFDGSSVTNIKDLVKRNESITDNNQVSTSNWDPRGYYTFHSYAINSDVDHLDGGNVGWKWSHDLRNQSTEATFEVVVETYQDTESQDIGICGQGSMWRLMQNQQKFRIWARENANGGTTNLNSGDIFTKNKWWHFVGTIKTNPGLMKIYANGEEVASQTTPWAWGAGHTTDVTNFGQSWWGDTDSYFRGSMRLFRMYTKQLSQEQVKQNYNTVKDWMAYAHETKTTW